MSKLFKRKLFLQIVIPSLVATFFVVAVVWGTTTIGSNITTEGTITLANGEYLDNRTNGYISLMGIASTTSIYFGTNGESIDNTTNGYISLMGIASTTSLYFGSNGESIDNRNNGYISLMGIASTTSIYFGSNGESIDNTTNGYISLMGIASTTSIYLGANGETIDNAVNGYINLNGNASTTALYFDKGEWIDNAVDGYINLNGNASTTALYFNNGEYLDNRTDGYISLMGVASTSWLYFGTNGEYIDNTNNGYISLMGIASTTSIYFGTNGETIDNVVNGYISMQGIASSTGAVIRPTSNGTLTVSVKNATGVPIFEIDTTNSMASTTALFVPQATTNSSRFYASSTAVSIGNGTPIAGVRFGTCTVTFGSIAASSTAVSTCAAPTVTSSDRVFVTPNINNPSIIFNSASSTTDVINVAVHNTGWVDGVPGTAVDPNDNVWAWMAVR